MTMASLSARAVAFERFPFQPPKFLDRLYVRPSPRTNPALGASFDEPSDADEFFTRNQFDRSMKETCHLFARSLYQDAEIQPVPCQGYCSYTLAISRTHLLQFRPERYQLNVKVCDEARMVYGSLVPRTQYLGCFPTRRSSDREPQLHVYIQERIPGISLKEFQTTSQLDGETQILFRKRLVEDLAEVFAISLHHGQSEDDAGEDKTFQKGKVGASLRWRLGILKGLPDDNLRELVAEVTSSMDHIDSLPWCLTHGDLVPANIMIDPNTGHLTGLIDWAEGEWLPLGVALYGLEEVLGYEDPVAGFTYHQEHEQLREVFWSRLLGLAGAETSEATWVLKTAPSRILGIFLWRGIAFDEGRIDRIVELGRDDSELQKLKLFLAAPGPPDSAKFH